MFSRNYLSINPVRFGFYSKNKQTNIRVYSTSPTSCTRLQTFFLPKVGAPRRCYYYRSFSLYADDGGDAHRRRPLTSRVQLACIHGNDRRHAHRANARSVVNGLDLSHRLAHIFFIVIVLHPFNRIKYNRFI